MVPDNSGVRETPDRCTLKFSTALRVLAFTFPLFVVSFAVLLGGSLLAGGLGDPFAARLLTRVAIGFGIAGIVNMILLVGMLGLNSSMEIERREHRRGFHKKMRQKIRKRMAGRHDASKDSPKGPPGLRE